jgi:L-ascorbate metabolism protein UlaG (beta-lactamase superfamily)
MIVTIGIVILVIVTVIWGFMQQLQFGKAPSGQHLERIKASPNFKDGAFQNISYTPALTEGVSYFKAFKQFFFEKSKRSKPAGIIPSKKIDLNDLKPEGDVLVWFGHSSYFMQVDGKKILVDPVFSGNASPITNTTKSFKGSDVYKAEDMPDIDYLFITHDHFDHLDYKTITALKPKIKKIITGLGVAAHLEHWGYDDKIIIEMDWNEQIQLEEGFLVNSTSARHFSGRTFKRNYTLWMAFVFTTPGSKIYFGGDSGYDTHFKKIGDEYGPFDLAILEDGQYNENWKYIHMMPEETVQAAIDLKAKKLLPVHWAKFALALHDWDEPIKRVVTESQQKEIRVLHPIIGEAVFYKNPLQANEWWRSVL